MNTTKLYGLLTPAERAALVFAYECRQDSVEEQRLWSFDPGFLQRRDALHHLALGWGWQRWRTQAAYNLAWGARLAASSRALAATDEKKRRREWQRLERLEIVEAQIAGELAALEKGLDELAADYGFDAGSLRSLVGASAESIPPQDAIPDDATLAKVRRLGELFTTEDHPQ